MTYHIQVHFAIHSDADRCHAVVMHMIMAMVMAVVVTMIVAVVVRVLRVAA